MTLEVHKTRTKPRVLIVEDEGLIAADIQSTLRRLGYHVSGIAASAKEALELAALFAAQVVLMDIKIRGPVDGIELAHEMRKRYQTPVVFLSSNTDPSTFERAEKTAPFGFVTKPYTEFHLKAAIELALSRREAEAASCKKEAGLSAVLESLMDAIIATDTDGRVVFMNKAAETLTGWSSDEAVRQHADDVLLMGHTTASELVGDVFSGDLLNAPVEVRSRSGKRMHRSLSGSALMNGMKKSGAVLLFRAPAVEHDGAQAASLLRTTEDMLATLCLLRSTA